MTAAELLTADEAIIAGAQEVCYRAADAGLPGENAEVTDALAELAAGIRYYRRIRSGALAPGDAYPGMCANQADGRRLAEALLVAAQDAAMDASQLVRVIASNHGDEMAALVSGQDKGEQS